MKQAMNLAQVEEELGPRNQIVASLELAERVLVISGFEQGLPRTVMSASLLDERGGRARGRIIRWDRRRWRCWAARAGDRSHHHQNERDQARGAHGVSLSAEPEPSQRAFPGDQLVDVAIPSGATPGDYDVLSVRFANRDDTANGQAWDATSARFTIGTEVTVP